MTFPAWLPPIVSCSGDWADVLKMLYAIFDRDFRNGSPRFRGMPVLWDRTIKPGEQYEEGFWHLITRDDPATGDRFPDFRRAEKLPWCRPTLDHEAEPEVRAWEYLEGGGKRRIYLWLHTLDYVIVLERRNQKRGPIAFLVTAYHVDGEGRRRHLAAKYVARLP